MCISAKESAIAFSVMIFIIRNEQYDRILASLLIVVSLVQLVEYFYHMKELCSDEAGRLLFIILWLQVAVLAFTVYLWFETTLTSWWCIIFVAIFLITLYYAFTVSFSVTQESGHLVWTKDCEKGTILGSYLTIIYLVGLIGPLFIILYYNQWKNVGMWIILGVVLLTILFTRWLYPSIVFPSMWCYSAIAIAFTMYLVGAFNEHTVYV